MPLTEDESWQEIQLAVGKQLIKDSRRYLLNECAAKWGWPLVVKADGLMAGKGVEVCENMDEALEFMNFLDPLPRLGE